MSTQQSIFLKMIYAYTNSKRFINIQPYTVLAKAGRKEKASITLQTFFLKFLPN